jgi:hypothetical protein
MPPPGGGNKKAEQNFANFMTSTAGGTQGSSSYGNNPPSGSFSSGSDSGNQNNQSAVNIQEEIKQQAQQNFQNQQQAQEEFEKKQEEEKKQSLIDQFDQFMTSFGQNKINIPFPSIATFGAAALEGMDSTNKFFKNLNTKKSGELSNKDKMTLINLVQRGGEGGGLQYLKNWAEDNDLSEEETMDLANKFTGEYSNIGSSISDSGINEYFDTKPEGFKDSVAAMFGQYRDEDNPGPNLEYVTDNLGTVGLEYLKATNPAAFYALRPAATSGQIEELAGTALTGNKDFDNQIFAAREQAARNKESQDRSSGIMSTPAFTIAPGQDAPPKPGGPGSTPDAPTGPSFTPQNTSPFDLSQFYAGLPSYSYGQQGVMSPNINPSLASYFENLKKYYGVG